MASGGRDSGQPLLYSEDRHILYSRSSCDPIDAVQKRSSPLPPPEYRAGSHAKTSHAIVILCSESRDDALPGVRWPGALSDEGQRRTSWIDIIPEPKEKLVEDQLFHTHTQYRRLFREKNCRACVDPTIERLTAVVTSTRKMTEDRIVFHYMHHYAPSIPALCEEGNLLLYCQDSNEHNPLKLATVHAELGAPAAYIFDCPHAGRLVNSLEKLGEADVVALGACSDTEKFQWSNLGLPADLLTACLLSPVKAALNFYRQCNATVLSEVAVRGSPRKIKISVFQMMSSLSR